MTIYVNNTAILNERQRGLRPAVALFYYLKDNSDALGVVNKSKDELAKALNQDFIFPGFGCENNINAITLHLNGIGVERLIGVAACKTLTLNNSGGETIGDNYLSTAFFEPVSAYTLGRSVVFYFSMDDNYSAGTYVNTTFTEDASSVSYGIED